ncbi:MAG: hypothetical protein M5R38_11765 [Candidatus Methylomirabilis sp.]|nr:hypothetical protein [Candidatus Methylomirabilis sp.]
MSLYEAGGLWLVKQNQTSGGTLVSSSESNVCTDSAASEVLVRYEIGYFESGLAVLQGCGAAFENNGIRFFFEPSEER